MNILSIDVAASKPTAYALFLDDKLSCYDKVPGIAEVEDIVAMIVDLNLIVAEDMYLGKNFDSVKKLCYEIGKLIYVADLHQVEYKLIRPVDWQRHHGLVRKTADQMAFLQTAIIKNATSIKIEDDDICATVLIRLCEIEKRRLQSV